MHLRDFWYATLQVNTNHTCKLTTLRHVSCTSHSCSADINEITQWRPIWKPHCAHDAGILLQRETPEFIFPEMWPPNSPDLNPVDYSVLGILQEGLPFADPWCERVERMSAEGVEAVGPLHHCSSNCTVVKSFESMCAREWWAFWT